MSAMSGYYELNEKMKPSVNWGIRHTCSGENKAVVCLDCCPDFFYHSHFVLHQPQEKKTKGERAKTTIFKTTNSIHWRRKAKYCKNVARQCWAKHFVYQKLHPQTRTQYPAIRSEHRPIPGRSAQYIQRSLPNQLNQYGLGTAMEALCDKVRESTNVFVSSDIQLPEDQMVSKELKINLYRIIQECISNSISMQLRPPSVLRVRWSRTGFI